MTRASSQDAETRASIAVERREQRRRLLLRMAGSPLFIAGGFGLALVVLASLVGPLLLQQDPLSVDASLRLRPPMAGHPFGTDTFGRDVLVRVLVGGRVSLVVGACTALLAGALGTIAGLYSAFYQWVDAIVMRIADGLMAFPAMLLAIALAAALGGSTRTLVIALSVVYAPRVARVVRSSALAVKQQTYVEALRSQGAGPLRLLWVNAFPNVAPALLIQATFVFADSLLVEAALSFIGLGVPAPQPSWGNMLLEGKAVIFDAWWLILFPGLAILVLILSVNLLGDGLRDVLDPQFSGGGRLARLWRRSR
ncbi:ABC transporter permease [Brooklawnia cerclae]|uniref:Peptide/nickel transport system permease protein n=1 Tax=Brooklawnia cerclae TaxID=349934 RepID=A0ABX0SKP9_9ACTN|nr:ABC transporter permease [Brooklawnia cerclae]NIH57908.1 peptide/nickel transport system permease protein [Brooklawnia cerclae]